MCGGRGYGQCDDVRRGGEVVCVYMGAPIGMHCAYTVRGAAAAVHVLWEQPMAVNGEECERMIAACDQAGV